MSKIRDLLLKTEVTTEPVIEDLPVLSVSKIFTGVASDMIITNYTLFSDDYPSWTLVSYCPDRPSANITTQTVAIHCMYEVSPYNGFIRQSNKTSGLLGVDLELNSGGTSRRYNKNTKVIEVITSGGTNQHANGKEVPIAVSRVGSSMFWSLDGTNWNYVADLTAHSSPLVFGGYRTSSGTYGRYYKSNGNYLYAELYLDSLHDVSSFINAHK